MTGPSLFSDPEVASQYESWYRGAGRRADRLEKKLLRRLLAEIRGARTILEVGCGTGHFTRWLEELSLEAVGVDLARPMLKEAIRLGAGNYLQADAHALPFADGSFDASLMVTTLEFVADPTLALKEAGRVARRGIILGALNRCSLLGCQLRSGKGDIRKKGRLFSPKELVRQTQHALHRKSARITAHNPLASLGELPAAPVGRFHRFSRGLGMIGWEASNG